MAVLLGLGALWAAVLAPDLLRRFNGRRRGDSIAMFHRHLSGLQRSNPGSVPQIGGSNVVPLSSPRSAPRPRPLAGAPRVAAPRPAASPAGGAARRMTKLEAQRRRQDVIVGLGAGALLTFLATVAVSGLFLYVHLLLDLALVAYLTAVLVVTRRRPAAQVAVLPERGGYAPARVAAPRSSVAR